MKTPVFIGSSVAIVTPFHNGSIDKGKLAEIIDFQIAGGTSAITICGTTGESATQTLEEHMDTVDFCTQHVNGRVKVIAGSGSNDTMAALQLSLSAQKSGVDGLLLVTPYYNKASQTGLIKHFSYIADRVDTPIILYDVPSRTGVGIASETFAELSKHPNINGVKDASGDFVKTSITMSMCGDDLNVWSGNDDQTLALMALGAKGVISVAANILPEVMAKLCRLCLDGDYKEAAKLHLKYTDIMNRLFVEVNPIPVKTAMNLLGMDVGELRLPLCEMAPGNLEILKKSMKNVGLDV